MLRYKIVAYSDRLGDILDVRSFDTPEKVIALINANVCVRNTSGFLGDFYATIRRSITALGSIGTGPPGTMMTAVYIDPRKMVPYEERIPSLFTDQ